MGQLALVPLLLLYIGLPILLMITLVAVTRWANASRREREAYHKSERLRRFAESQGAGDSSVIEFLQGEEKIAARRRREGQKLGGLITIAVGLGMMIFIAAIAHGDQKPAYLVGVIPLLIGVALLAYAYVLAPKE